MKAEPPARVDTLRAHLRRGIASGVEVVDVQRALGLGAEATDAEVARALVARVAAADIEALGSASAPLKESVDETLRVRNLLDTSFLGQLDVGGSAPLNVDDLDDARTLLCVLRAGSFVQRRAAAQRLVVLLRQSATVADASEISNTIGDIRDPALERVLLRVRAELPGGGDNGGDNARLEALVLRLRADVEAYWDGERPEEPVAALATDQRLLLFHRLSDVPALLLGHIAAVLEGDDAGSGEDARAALLASCRYAADPRLAPALISLLEAAPPTLRVEAGRALANIDDPRVRPALRAAYERAVEDEERVILGGALGATGDLRAAAFVRTLLPRAEGELRRLSLQALEHLGDDLDVDPVLDILGEGDGPEVWQVVRTLGRVGEARARKALAALYARTRIPGLEAEIEEADAAIRARLELRGEKTQALTRAPLELSSGEADTPLGARLRGYWDYLVGHFFVAIGAAAAGRRCFDRATARRPSWGLPWIAIAMLSVREGENATALTAFRRALALDRVRLERNPIFARALARVFLRRAEDLDRDGRTDIARGLLGEALSFDLRRAPSRLRIELERQRELLQRRAVR